MSVMKRKPFPPMLPFLLVQLLVSIVRIVPAHAQVPDGVLDSNVCDIAAHPEAFDGKLVRVRARIISGFEVFAVGDTDNRCKDTLWLTYPGGGPEASVSLGTNTPSVQRAPVILRKDGQFKLFEKYLNAEMHPTSEGSICVACHRYEVIATLTGRVDFAEEGGAGFGHLNQWNAQFILQVVANVKAHDLSVNYDPKEYSAHPVKFPTGYITGKLLDPTAKPIALAPLTLSSIEDVPLYKHDFEGRTDTQGKFKFAVPPGKYILAINLKTPPSKRLPYDTTYSPGTTDRASAGVITVQHGQHVDHLTMRFTARLHERSFSGKVIWPDGRAVPSANVWLTEVEQPKKIVGRAVSHADDKGDFTLLGFEGRDYFVRASIYVKPLYDPFCAEKARVNSSQPPDGINLTLTVEGQVCKDWKEH